MKRRMLCLLMVLCLLMGVMPVSVATAVVTGTETLITQTSNLSLVIPARDNLLVKAQCSETTLAATACPNVYNGTINDNVYNIKEKYMVGALGNDLWVTYTFSAPTAVDTVLVAGSGQERDSLGLGFEGFSVYVGDKDAAAIQADSSITPNHTYTDIVKEAVRVDFAETITATYVVFRLGIHRDAKWTGNVWISEMAACSTGDPNENKPLEPLDPTTGDENGVRGYAVAISPGMNEEKIISAADNLLVDAACSDSTLGFSVVPDLYNGVINDNKWNRKEPYLQETAGNLMWVTYTFAQPTEIGAVLVNGSGVERNNLGLGFEGFAVYAGERDAAAIRDNPTLRPIYSQTAVVKNAVRVNFSRAVTVTKLVFCFGIHRDANWNGNVWISELAAADADAIAAQTVAIDENNYADAALQNAENILKGAELSASVSAPSGLLTDGVLSNVTADDEDGSACWNPVLDTDSLYVTFTLPAEYDVSRLLLAGSGRTSYGVEGFAVYADKRFDALTEEDAPFFTYEGSVVHGLQVNLGVPITTKTLTFKITCRNDADAYLCWLSELGATGTTATVRSEKIVCVGDSITYGFVFSSPTGWGGGQTANPYPAQLQAMLTARSEGVSYRVVNAGISASAVIGEDMTIPGTSTTFPGSGNGTPSTWLVQQASIGGVQEADKVLIMLGTNDAGGTANWNARAPYYEEFYKKIINAFRAKNPDVEIYVVTAPYTSVESHYANLKNGVVPLQKKMAASLGLPVIDVWEATRHFVEEENGGDLSSFIHPSDMGNGLKVHPHETGLGVIAKTCFDALTGDENDLYAVKSNGAQLRDDQNGKTAVRFGMSVPCQGVTADDKRFAQLTADSKITIGGISYPITDMGTVVAIKDKLENPVTDLVAGISHDWAKDVPARKLYSATDDGVTYTAVVTNVREENVRADLVARGYVQYRDGDTLRYAYGPVTTRTAAQVRMKHLEEVYNVQRDTWRGFERLSFSVEGRVCYLVKPHVAAKGNHWMWRTEFFDNANAAVDTDVEMLERGWYLAYCTVSNMYGSPEAVRIMKAYRDVVVPLADLDPQAVLMGASRGGLYAVNYAATHPDTVAGLYLDAPVQDVCSWPGDLHRQGLNANGSSEWGYCKQVCGFANDAAALADRSFSPKWKYPVLIENEIPVLLVYGDVDDVVPFEENAQYLVDAYTEAGLTDILKVKCFEGRGHHPHGWPGGASAYIVENMG